MMQMRKRLMQMQELEHAPEAQRESAEPPELGSCNAKKAASLGERSGAGRQYRALIRSLELLCYLAPQWHAD